MSASDNFDGLKVMVIDDSNTIRRSAEIFLGKTGARVVLAEDGFDALAKIADHQPDLIFCDVMMPRLDGYQTCALIKKSPKFKSTPVVMLSSKDGLFDKAKGRMVGSDHYLTKPFTKDSLLQAVAEFARRPPEQVSAAQAAAAAADQAHAAAAYQQAPQQERAGQQAAGPATVAAPELKSPELDLPEGDLPQPAVDLFKPSEKFTLSLV